MIVATDDNALRMVAGSQGAGYISANLLLEELRIAYRGWEQLQEDLEVINLFKISVYIHIFIELLRLIYYFWFE